MLFRSIKGILPDTIPTTTTQIFTITSNQVSIANTTAFATFEGITTSIGYALINSEVIEYQSDGNGNLVVSQRGVDGSPVLNHPSGSQIRNYEVSGVSLRKINTSHNLPSNLSLGYTRDIDTLPIRFNRQFRPNGNSQLNFDQEQSVGGDNGLSTLNVQFNRIVPALGTLIPGPTVDVSSTVRTVSGTSVSGDELSFVDQGNESVNLNSINSFSTPRLIASRENEIANVIGINNSKSFTLAVQLSTTDRNLSPLLDMQSLNLFLFRSRLNQPILNYADDPRVNLLVGDPHGSIYIGNKIGLRNPATSLKVIIGAYRDSSADFRVLYRIFEPNGDNSSEPTWSLFPGYRNMTDNDGDGFGDTVVDPSKNSGLPDVQVNASTSVNEFLEYQFTANDLPEFSAFQLKIVFSGTNEARAPRISDIRAIALA